MSRTALLRWVLSLAALSAFAGCSDEQGPIAGDWTQATADGEVGVGITFDAHSDKVSVHLKPHEGGGHDHAGGDLTYDFDEKTKKLTVRAELLGRNKAGVWKGAITEDRMTLAADAVSMTFVRGNRHGH